MRGGGALHFNRAGTISASTPIERGDALAQIIVMGSPAHRRPARNLVIFDYRFKRLEIMAMAVGESLEAAKAKQSRFVQGYHELDSARLWISAEVWPCPICACHNPSGMLICIGLSLIHI